jgi:hypothetical protein
MENICFKCHTTSKCRDQEEVMKKGHCPYFYDLNGGRFMLAELALEHPQSLHDALSSLPFKASLNFYLE